MSEWKQEIVLQPIGVVRSPRDEAIDDFWGSVESVIELDPEQFTADVAAGLSDFSHVDVVFFMNRVRPEKIETTARHPRGNTEWPKVGIFAQRAKGRPNRLGVTNCQLVKVEGLRITVRGLDAIEGTPVVDLKPYMAEFGPRGDVKQPEWSHVLMKEYFLG
ncbi:tRNA-Thr(GGU) m(6)t(6)A37 methyltransferase TsaA [Tumebacillus sp. BK434]|uniref:SAM-dependent methyltransferase n=1 Tax=Tumebacillus sp. BK434 TaxID=2512169 RepID=UPI0010498E33|nr:SAM-dependent methyltransferase [Tumebacillus sp. BK434]TCP58073.1 tRNA-Thr(GGU) m(6)t(6)A37 methyltransferase TsaA [Tumebacillus sp. BK434]